MHGVLHRKIILFIQRRSNTKYWDSLHYVVNWVQINNDYSQNNTLLLWLPDKKETRKIRWKHC